MRISPINNSFYQKRLPAQTFKQAPVQNVVKRTFVPAAMFLAALAVPISAKEPVYKVDSETVVHQEPIVMNDTNYNLVLTNAYAEDSLGVSEIFFVPENKKDSAVMRLEQLVYHNFDDSKKNYVSIFVSENQDSTAQEVQLSKEAGEQLLNVYNGNTPFYLIPGVNTYVDSYEK